MSSDWPTSTQDIYRGPRPEPDPVVVPTETQKPKTHLQLLAELIVERLSYNDPVSLGSDYDISTAPILLLLTLGFLNLVALIIWGCTVKMLWGWFLANPFNIPSLGIIQVFGLHLLQRAFVFGGKIGTRAEKEIAAPTPVVATVGAKFDDAIYNMIVPGLIFLLGFILHFFV